MTCATDHYFSEFPQHDFDVFVLEFHRIVGLDGHLHVLECSIVYQPSYLPSSLPAIHNTKIYLHEIYLNTRKSIFFTKHQMMMTYLNVFH